MPTIALALSGREAATAARAVVMGGRGTARRNTGHRTMEIRLYHNPRCSKSRQALQLLRERGVEPVVIEYLKTPPRREEIDDLLAKLGAEPRELMRSNEPEYAALGLARAELSREQLIQALLDNPKLLQRPIAVAGDRAVIGRPPERVLELLER